MQKHSTLLSITATDNEPREPIHLRINQLHFPLFIVKLEDGICSYDSCNLLYLYIVRELIGSRELYDHRGRGMFWGSSIRSS